MSIEEFLDREIERGNFLSQKDTPPPKKHEDDMNAQEYEQELYRVRDFDDFKDANPRGWGNRMNKG
jgi:hypothetical protein